MATPQIGGTDAKTHHMIAVMAMAATLRLPIEDVDKECVKIIFDELTTGKWSDPEAVSLDAYSNIMKLYASMLAIAASK